MQTFISTIFLIINKNLDLNNDFNSDIFINIPLNFFTIEVIKTKIIKIKYNSRMVKKVWKKLCKETIIKALFNLDGIDLDNFIKGGIFEEGVKQIILQGNSFFGKIENKVKFNCILNYFIKNKTYDFTKDQLKNTFSKSKIIKNLKNKYKNFKFNNNFVINQKQNGKDWDLAFVYKNAFNQIILFLLQITVNKTVDDIKVILEYLDNKINVIKAKIYEILKIKINEVHILFIFKDSINNKTTSFCSQFSIPFIYYDYLNKIFVDTNMKDIDYNNLLISTSYENNNIKWKNALNYEQKKIKMITNINEQNIDSSSDSDTSDIYYKQSQININDILVNHNFHL